VASFTIYPIAFSLFISDTVDPATLQRRLVTGGCDNLVKIWRYLDREDKWEPEAQLEGTENCIYYMYV